MAISSMTYPPKPDEGAPSKELPPERKWCQCGCKETLPIDSHFNFLRQHRARMMNKGQSPAPADGGSHLSNVLAELRKEILWRRNRQKYLEQEVGVNMQKIRMLEQSLTSLEAVQGGEARPT